MRRRVIQDSDPRHPLAKSVQQAHANWTLSNLVPFCIIHHPELRRATGVAHGGEKLALLRLDKSPLVLKLFWKIQHGPCFSSREPVEREGVSFNTWKATGVFIETTEDTNPTRKRGRVGSDECGLRQIGPREEKVPLRLWWSVCYVLRNSL